VSCDPSVVYVLDGRGGIVDANEAGCVRLGCERNGVTSFTFHDIQFRANKNWTQLWEEIVESGVATMEGKWPTTRGVLCPVTLTARYLRISGVEYAVVSANQSIEAYPVPGSPHDTQETLQAIFEGVETGIFIIDPENHRIVDANPVALSVTGTSRAEMVGAVCHQFVCPAEKGRCPVTDLGQTVDNSERILLTSKGERRSIIKTVRPIKMSGRSYLLESFLDITARKHAERELEERTSYLHALIEASPLGTAVLDKDERIRMLNSAFEQLFLYSREAAVGQVLQELIVPDEDQASGKEMTRECLSGKSVKVEGRRRRSDNTLIDVEIYGVPLVKGAEVDGILVVYRDITQEKGIEAELRSSENRFRTAFEDAPYGMCITSLDGHFLHANIALCRMLGYSAPELLAGAWQQITHPDDLERSRQIAIQFSKGAETTLELEKRYLHKQGNIVWAHLKISLVKDIRGEASHYITQIEDITLRKQADEAKAFLVSLVESSQDAIVGTSPGGVIMSWNRGATELYGYIEEEVIGKPLSILVPDDLLSEILDKIRAGGKISGFETFQTRKDGTQVDVSLAISPVFDASGKVSGLASTARDITRWKQAEQALQCSEEKFRQLAENISEVFWMMPPEGNEIHYVSPAYEPVWGRSCEDVYRNPTAWSEAIHPEDQKAAHEIFGRQLQGERIDSIYRILTPAGEQKWIRDRAFPVRDQRGQLTRIVGLAEDISARRQAEESLRASEERYRELFENASDLVYTFALDLQITSMNRLAELTTGYSREDSTKMNLQQFVEAREWPRVHQVMSQLIDGIPTSKTEFNIDAKDGRKVRLEMNPRLIYHDGKPVGIQAIARDITGRDAAEIELRQAQKLESVGRLASGIAHEINTPIQFVGDNVRFLQDAFRELAAVIHRLSEPRKNNDGDRAGWSAEHHNLSDTDWNNVLEEIPRAISQTLEGVERVVTIVRAMKEFAHPESRGMAPTDLNKAISNTLTVARNELKYVADVETDFEDLPPVYCTVSDMNQVFLNLLVNAAHAIGDVVKGTGKKGKIRVSTRHEAGTALITISDTGSGIPESIRDHIFDPFFTTKEVGRGTGQGLAIARSVVDRHKGTLTFASEVGKGTSFVVRLPIFNSDSEPDHS